MTAIRAAALAALIVLSGVAISAPAAGAGIVGFGAQDDADAGADADPALAAENGTGTVALANGTSMGSEISSFMQASSADADESIEAGMFAAEFENGDNETRRTAVVARTERLEQRLTDLRAEYERLQENRDEINSVAYRARLTNLAVRLSKLDDAVDQTAPRAESVGVETERLAEIRRNASEMSGPEIAAIASSVSGVEPPRGPPEDVPGNGPPENAGGPPGNDGDASGPGEAGSASNGAGPPDHAGNGPENAGPKDDSAAGDEDAGSTGNAGNGPGDAGSSGDGPASDDESGDDTSDDDGKPGAGERN